MIAVRKSKADERELVAEAATQGEQKTPVKKVA
jgi:hypothetical protein